jgi:hypothetical protein
LLQPEFLEDEFWKLSPKGVELAFFHDLEWTKRAPVLEKRIGLLG